MAEKLNQNRVAGKRIAQRDGGQFGSALLIG